MEQKVAILLTVFNRKAATLECLNQCYVQIDSLKGVWPCTFKIYMVDDGCTDGTSEAVREKFPQTEIIKGDGGLFWNYGMRLAWETASKDNPDFYIWLNTTTFLKENAIACLMETSAFLKHRAIIVGTAENDMGEISCGGRTRYGKIVIPDQTLPVPCRTFNGNFVLIPSYVHRILGNLDEHYRHRFGDLDYGVRAVKHNIVRVVAPGVICKWNQNAGIPKWNNRKYPLRERAASLRSPQGRPPGEQFRYDCRSRGVIFAFVHCISTALKVLFPMNKMSDDE